MIPKDTIDRIFDAAVIEEVIGEFVTLKKSGTSYRALSPFSNEKTPSFFVVPHKGIFKDFSSGKGGNAVTFLMEHERMTYPEALRWLAARYQIEIEEEKPDEAQLQAASERESLGVVTQFALGHFEELLWEDEEGRAVGLSYLRGRGYRDDIIKKFQLGYSKEDWGAFTTVALEKEYQLKYLIKSGLTKEKNDRQYDFFRGRVMFPIHSLSGKAIAFGGRTLRSDKKTAKYINSPESEIYNKSRVLYGMHLAKTEIMRDDQCLLVEGYTDVISLHQSGVENVVASAGTALTPDQIKLIKRYTKNITVLFDGDDAGIRASFRGIDLLLEAEMNVRVVLFPDGDDPDSFASKTPSDELKVFLKEGAQDFMTFKADRLMADAGDDPIRRSEMISELVKSIAIIPSAPRREVYIQECSRLVGITEQTLMHELNKALRANFKRTHKAELAGVEIPIEAPKEIQKATLDIDHHERDLLRILLTYGSHVLALPVEEGSEDEIETTVAEFMITELLEDDLRFRDEDFNTILDEYCDFLENGELPPEKHFFQHSDPKISTLAAGMLADQYQLSSNWSLIHEIYVEREVAKLEDAVKAALIRYKIRLIELKLKELEEELRQPGLATETERLVLARVVALNKAKMHLAAMSRTVIVH